MDCNISCSNKVSKRKIIYWLVTLWWRSKNDSVVGLKVSWVVITIEWGPSSFIDSSSPTYFKIRSVIGSPNPNCPWYTHILPGFDICSKYPRGKTTKSGALPTRISKIGSRGLLGSHGKLTAIWPLEANGVES